MQRLREGLEEGWGTWYRDDMTTHALLPQGVGLSMHLVNASGVVLDKVQVHAKAPVRVRVCEQLFCDEGLKLMGWRDQGMHFQGNLIN